MQESLLLVGGPWTMFVEGAGLGPGCMMHDGMTVHRSTLFPPPPQVNIVAGPQQSVEISFYISE